MEPLLWSLLLLMSVIRCDPCDQFITSKVFFDLSSITHYIHINVLCQPVDKRINAVWFFHYFALVMNKENFKEERVTLL